MTHEEFVAAHRAGSLQVHIDRKQAAQLVSGRMLLPFVLLPLLGLAVALAITGQAFWGVGLFLAVMAFRFLVRASGGGFVFAQALKNETFYRQAVTAGLLYAETADTNSA